MDPPDIFNKNVKGILLHEQLLTITNEKAL